MSRAEIMSLERAGHFGTLSSFPYGILIETVIAWRCSFAVLLFADIIKLKGKPIMGFVGKLEEIRARARQHDEIPEESDAGQSVNTAATVKHSAKKAARR
jgi:hypothetical protein